MKGKDLSVLLKKADELRALFVLGQRVIPFLEEIFVFVSEIQPLLDELNSSIKENLKKMPNASKQLSKVTEATELATNEIMDIVDGIVYKSEIIASNLKNITDIEAKRRKTPIKLLEIIFKAVQGDEDLNKILPQMATIIENMKTMKSDEYDKVVADTNELLQSISIDSSSIMISLQVQDITSQQIAAVNNLLETVQRKLASIMDHFQNSDINDLVKNNDDSDLFYDKIKTSKLHREIAFDPDAVDAITSKDFRQGQVDQFMQEHHDSSNGVHFNEPASQDDIDALFDNPSVMIDVVSLPEMPAKPMSIIETPEKEISIEDDFEQFSQDDIDAMFGK